MSAINLLPPKYREKRRMGMIRKRWIITGGCYVLLLAAGGLAARGFDTIDDNSVRTQIAKMGAQATQAEARQKTIMTELTRLSADRQLRELVNSPVDYAILLAGLGKCVHEDAILTGLRWEVMPAAAPDRVMAGPGEKTKLADPFAGPVRLKVEMTGLVQEQPAIGRLVRRIHDSGLFDQVRLVKSSREGFLSSNAFSFQIECEILAARASGGVGGTP
jgi:hypothetical protein